MSQETWKPIPGMPGYEASDLGRIRSFRRNPAGSVLRAAKVGRGYLMVCPCLEGKSQPFRVHHLVLFAFVGPRPAGMVGCHTNDVPDDNRIANLRWDTPESNVADRKARGYRRKTDHYRGMVLTAAMAAEIYESPRSQEALASEYGISRWAVRGVKAGDRWARVTRPLAEKRELQALADAQLRAAAPTLLFALRQIVRDLPHKRDWLDPALESLAREAITLADADQQMMNPKTEQRA